MSRSTSNARKLMATRSKIGSTDTKKLPQLGVFLVPIVIGGVALFSGCGGGSSSGSGGGGSSPPPVISISVTPTSADVAFGATQQFTATVSGTSNTAVTWSVSSPGVSPVTGGNSQLGTMSSTGLYTAPKPAPLPNPLAATPTSFSVAAGDNGSSAIAAGTLNLTPQVQSSTVTITATSQADPTRSASATVTLAALSLFAVGTCPSLTPGTTCTAGSTGIEANAGSTVTLFVVGEGLVNGTSFSISNPPGTPDAIVDPTSVQYFTTQGTPAYPCATFNVTVSPAAQVGPRNIMVTDAAGELAVFPGGLQICPATGCTP